MLKVVGNECLNKVVYEEDWKPKAYELLWSAMIVLAVVLMVGLYSRIVYTLWFKRDLDNEVAFQQRVSIEIAVSVRVFFCEFLLRFLFVGLQIQFLLHLMDLSLSLYTQGIMRVRKRVSLMVITITAIFGICWLPDRIAHIIDDHSSVSVSTSTYTVLHTLVLFNSTVNPFVYALMSQTFREKFKGMMCCRCTGSVTKKTTGARKSSDKGKNKEPENNEAKVF